jgi:hypothetical protein
VPSQLSWNLRGGRVPERKLLERTTVTTYSEQRGGGMPAGRLREDGRVLFDVGSSFRDAGGAAAYSFLNKGRFNDPSFACRGYQISQARPMEDGESPSTQPNYPGCGGLGKCSAGDCLSDTIPPLNGSQRLSVRTMLQTRGAVYEKSPGGECVENNRNSHSYCTMTHENSRGSRAHGGNTWFT